MNVDCIFFFYYEDLVHLSMFLKVRQLIKNNLLLHHYHHHHHDTVSDRSLAIIMAITTLFVALRNSFARAHLNQLLRSSSHNNFPCPTPLLPFITLRSIFWKTLYFSFLWMCLRYCSLCSMMMFNSSRSLDTSHNTSSLITLSLHIIF